MSINPLANRPRADACGFGNGLRRLPARDLPYNALSPARRQPGILMHVHPVLPWNLKLQQPQLPRSEPDGQPTESSQLDHGRMHVRRAKNGTPSVHPIRGDEIRALRKLRRESPAEAAYVFVTERGG